MEYQKELKRLEENEEQGSGDFWKPEAGQYKIKALGELEEGKPYEKEGEEPKLRKQLKIRVNADGEDKEILWTMPFGLTPVSTYGQLVKLGSVKGKLTDTEFSVVVVGTGTKRRFTIVF